MSYELIADIGLPPRSTLHIIQPLGRSTGHRECLYSWLLRTAFSVSLSVADVVRLAFNAGVGINNNNLDAMHEISKFSFDKAYLAGKHSQILNIMSGLSKLTGFTNLSSLTLVPYLMIIPSKLKGGRIRKWCPVCLADDYKNGVPYHRLLWDFALCTACPFHKVKLINSCSNCHYGEVKRANGEQQIVSLILPGYCGRCGGWLAGGDGPKIRSANNEEVSIAYLFYHWLEAEQDLKSWDVKNVPKVLNFVAANYFENKWSQIAPLLGTTKSSLHGWLHENHEPSLANILTMASKFNLSVSDLLSGRTATLSLDMPSPEHSRRTNRKTALNWKAIAVEFRKCLSNKTPISLVQFSLKIGVSLRSLTKKEPILSRKVAQRYISFCEQRRLKNDEIALKVAISLAKEKNFSSKKFQVVLKDMGIRVSWSRRAAILSKISHCKQLDH